MSVSACPACGSGGITEAVLDKTSAVAQSSSADQTLLFSLPDIHCAACIAGVEAGVSRLAGVRDARVNLTRKQLRLTADPALEGRVIEALSNLGYRALPLDTSTLATRRDEAGRRLLMRLGVSGFAMMNVMLLSVSVWSGAADVTRDFLHLVSAVIALPAVAFAAVPFFTSAFGALRAGRLNMDVPISLAIVLASLTSLYETIHGGEHAYFDAALSLTFFLLLGRYLNHITRASSLSAAAELAALEPRKALLCGPVPQLVPVETLKLGDVVLVPMGAHVPVDGEIISGQGEVDTARLTGETMPQPVSPGREVFAGMVNLGEALEVRMTRAPEASLAARIRALVEQAETARSRYTGLAEQAARIYAPLVHGLAALAFLGWYLVSGDLRLSVTIATAVLIITCPCALGLAVPAVMSAAVSRLFSLGVLVKDGSAIERMAVIDKIVFDKTGTLTRGKPELVSDLPPEQLALAAGLARGSAHPLSEAVLARADALGIAPVSDLVDRVEHPGLGVSAHWRGQAVALGRSDWVDPEGTTSGAEIQNALGIGEQAVSLRYVDSIRPETSDLLAWCHGAKLAPALLSGDRAETVQELADRYGLKVLGAAVMPDEKLELIQGQGAHVAMVGDGLNDTAAMQAASVSIAPGAALDITRRTADFILMNDDLSRIPKLARISSQARKRILENFAIAAIYNMVAVPVAFFGYATPLAAAIAMSTSSILVSLNAYRLYRSAS